MITYTLAYSVSALSIIHAYSQYIFKHSNEAEITTSVHSKYLINVNIIHFTE